MTKRRIFFNLPVRDLNKSKEFFTRLGFEFNPQFTDENATCVVINDDACVMLLVEPFFQTFTHKPLCDARKQTESICAISVDSRAEVDAITQRALAAGATTALEPKNMGFMYNTSFYDLDGHHWEVLWMDPAAMQ